jgi:hypothetical protein
MSQWSYHELLTGVFVFFAILKRRATPQRIALRSATAVHIAGNRHVVYPPEIRERAVMVARREDEAASELIGPPANLGCRGDALVEIQNLANEAAPAQMAIWRTWRAALRARWNAKKAMGAYGRICS